MDGEAFWKALRAFARNTRLYWFNTPKWRFERCARGKHEVLANWHDDEHATLYCRWCAWRKEQTYPPTYGE